jgi:hypothetical protein
LRRIGEGHQPQAGPMTEPTPADIAIAIERLFARIHTLETNTLTCLQAMSERLQRVEHLAMSAELRNATKH